jgi:hypothetical protein
MATPIYTVLGHDSYYVLFVGSGRLHIDELLVLRARLDTGCSNPDDHAGVL